MVDEIFTGYDSYRSIIINLIKKLIYLKIFMQILEKILEGFSNDPKEMYISFSEQNIYKDLNKYFKNMKFYNKTDLSLNHCRIINYRIDLIMYVVSLDTVIPNDFLLGMTKT